MKLAVLDIEIYDTDDPKETWAQARYLVHGWDDFLWTDDLDTAMRFLADSVRQREKSQ